MENKKELNFIHFNDVYDIQENNENNQLPVGGASRFKTVLDQLRKENPDILVFFSGDVFSPSILSSIFNGQQMIIPLNSFNVDVGCYGNHDLDFSEEDTYKLVTQVNFPWVMSNIFDLKIGKTIFNSVEYHIIEQNNIKIGVIGLAEQEWIPEIQDYHIMQIEYEDFIICAQRLCNKLKNELKCDIIVALTHMRLHNDKKLCSKVKDIDFVLGGHDHIVFIENINDSLLLKSGTNFEQLSFTQVIIEQDEHFISNKDAYQHKFVLKNKILTNTKFIQINKSIQPNPKIDEHVNFYMKQCEEKMNIVMGYTDVPLETRFEVIRCQESNWPNFFADVIKVEMGADLALVNTGTVRSNCVFQKGKITLEYLSKMLPLTDVIVVKQLSGKQIHEMLECSFAKYPAYEGRFPALSGMRVKFDPKQPPFQRVKKEDIQVNGKPLDYDETMKFFVSQGKDGYDVLAKCKYLIDDVQGVQHMDCLRNFFQLQQKYNQNQKKINEKIQQEMNELNSNEKKLTLKKSQLENKYSSKLAQYQNMGLIKEIIHENDYDYIKISPQIEGRVQIL